MHHRRKRSAGGKWVPSCVVALCGDGCRGCHGWVEANPNEAEAQGWHVRPWQDPAEIPVLWHGEAWLLLKDDGSTEESEDPSGGQGQTPDEAE